jgi:hypothetical protein
MVSAEGHLSDKQPCKKWGSKVAMLLGSFLIYWQIFSENAIFQYKNTFCSKKICQNTGCAAKMSAAFGILLNSATGSFGTFPYVVLVLYIIASSLFLML